jgi:hypothetical protein
MTEQFFAYMEIPESCRLDKRVFKKLFLENGTLNVTDKKAFSEDILNITWRYTFKPETINIPRYEDDEREYHEVAILQIDLKKSARYKRIAQIVQRTIPYPVLIVFSFENSVALSAAEKRINRADTDKVMVEVFHETDWIELDAPTSAQQPFLESLSIRTCSFDNYLSLYSDMVARIVALNCGALSGDFVLYTDRSREERVQGLDEVRRLQQQESELRSALKKEEQFNRKVDLNMKIKHVAEEIAEYKARL